MFREGSLRFLKVQERFLKVLEGSGKVQGRFLKVQEWFREDSGKVH